MALPVIVVRLILASVVVGLLLVGYAVAGPSPTTARAALWGVALVTFVAMVARVGFCLMGWDALARAFPLPAHDRPIAWDASVASIALRSPFLRINNAVLWHEDDVGLRLKIIQPLSLGTRPAFIPWAAVANIRPVRGLPGTVELAIDPTSNATPTPTPAGPTRRTPPRIYIPDELAQPERARRSAT